MIEGYIIEGKRFLRGDPEPDFFTSDKVFARLSDAVEESRKIYEELLGFIKEDGDESYYDDEEDLLDENFFTDDLSDRNAGYFSVRDIDEYFAEGFLKKVSINLGDKKLEEANSGHREESTEE